MHKFLKNAAILTAITVISGILLGLVYEITKGPIEKLAAEKLHGEAFKSVFEDAASFEDDSGFDPGKASGILEGAGIKGTDILSDSLAKDADGNVLGHVVTAVSHEGIGGDIKLTVGIKSDGEVNGIDIVEMSETIDFANKADEPEFKSLFKGKKVDAFVCTTKGEEGDEMIDAISGATFTSKAVIGAVNSAIVYFQNVTGGGAGE